MKKVLSLLLIFILATAFLAGCGGGQSSDTGKQTESQPSEEAKPITIKVGASPIPHAEILYVVKPLLEKEGIIEYTDYVQPNIQLAEKELDANYFQHIPYLEDFSKEHNLDLTYTTKVHIEPMGIYSQKISNLNELKDGATIAIPNDANNGGRALMLLERAGILKLKEGVGITATVNDIAENPKNVQITELEAAMLPRMLRDFDAAVINTNYALEAGLVPTKDALAIESADSPYVNVLALRKGDESRPELKKLGELLNSPEVKKFIEEKYEGAVVPAF